MVKRKSLLVGCNYFNSDNQLRGCIQDVDNVANFLYYRGYKDDSAHQVILTDDEHHHSPYYPSGANILSAIDWLISEPGTCNFFHYSGHGSQVSDPYGKTSTGLLDTICPADFAHRGQIDSDILHRHLVSHLPPNSTLFVILDCCHSGSALELPYVYHSDDYGNVGMRQNLMQGAHLFREANDMLLGGFSTGEAQDLYSGASSLFQSFKHRHDPEGLGQDNRFGYYAQENKMVSMFSGCRDEQTSADADISGTHAGAMSYSFLEMISRYQYPTYTQALAETRSILRNSHYTQVPQLSIGQNIELNQYLVL